MDYIANVENSEIDVSGIRTVLVQGDSSYPVIRFVLDPSLTGLSWRVRGTYTDSNIPVLSPEIVPVESSTEITLDWSVSSDFTTYYGNMQLVVVGANDSGTVITKALGEVTIQRDWSIGSLPAITLNLFEQLFAQTESAISTHNTDVRAHGELFGAVGNKFDNLVNKTTNIRKPYITIIEDDGRSTFISNGHSGVISSHPGAKISLAINPDKIGTYAYLTWDQISEFAGNSQYEILNHGWSHQEPLLLSAEAIEANYLLEKSILEQHGIYNAEYYVYPGYTPPPASPCQVRNADLKNKLRKTYKCCLNNAQSADNYIPIDMYDVKRIGLYSSTTIAYIDYCIQNSLWCILFFHSWMDGQNDSSAFNTVLNYIDSLVSNGLLQYTTVKQMVDEYSNLIDLGGGTIGADAFRLDRNGNFGGSLNGSNIYALLDQYCKVKSDYFSDSDVSKYGNQSLTIERLSSYSLATGMGLPDIGTVITTRIFDTGTLSGVEYFAYQEYIRTDRSEQWMRKWVPAAGRWTNWYPSSFVSRASTARPRYCPTGIGIFDSTLSKPIWSSTYSYTANVSLARNTAYKKWDVINPTGGSIFVCITAGTSGSDSPVFDTSATYKNTADGSVIWQYVGELKTTWRDAAGNIV